MTVGESLPAVCKGPLTVTSVIAFVQGWGSLYVRAHGLAFDLFERHPALGIPNEFGSPEPPERVHWDEPFARAVGVPGAYDYGPERVAWLGHLVTNWMGDRGELRRLSAQVRRHNLIGDVTWCHGTVVSKDDAATHRDARAAGHQSARRGHGDRRGGRGAAAPGWLTSDPWMPASVGTDESGPVMAAHFACFASVGLR